MTNPVVRFVEDDRGGLWAKGDLADDLGLEWLGGPNKLLRLQATGEVISLTRPYSRGLVEPVEEEDEP